MEMMRYEPLSLLLDDAKTRDLSTSALYAIEHFKAVLQIKARGHFIFVWTFLCCGFKMRLKLLNPLVLAAPALRA